jgi:hypothetical protein
VCPDVVGIKNEKCLKESSPLKTGLDKTEIDKKLTLRKRKSNTTQDNDCKKRVNNGSWLKNNLYLSMDCG